MQRLLLTATSGFVMLAYGAGSPPGGGFTGPTYVIPELCWGPLRTAER